METFRDFLLGVVEPDRAENVALYRLTFDLLVLRARLETARRQLADLKMAT